MITNCRAPHSTLHQAKRPVHAAPSPCLTIDAQAMPALRYHTGRWRYRAAHAGHWGWETVTAWRQDRRAPCAAAGSPGRAGSPQLPRPCYRHGREQRGRGTNALGYRPRQPIRPTGADCCRARARPLAARVCSWPGRPAGCVWAAPPSRTQTGPDSGNCRKRPATSPA